MSCQAGGSVVIMQHPQKLTLCWHASLHLTSLKVGTFAVPFSRWGCEGPERFTRGRWAGTTLLLPCGGGQAPGATSKFRILRASVGPTGTCFLRAPGDTMCTHAWSLCVI